MRRGREFVFRTEHICKSDAFPLKIMWLQFALPRKLARFLRSADAMHICEPDPLKRIYFQMFCKLDGV